MKFRHLVRINDASDAQSTALSREQLWRGLVLRAENPLLFVLALERFEILARSAAEMTRVLHFGDVRLRDRVLFSSMREVRYEIEASAQTPAAALTMAIVEPEPGQLCVRFDYETQAEAGQQDAEIEGMLRQAYVQSDLDTIRTIRRLVSPPVKDKE